MKDNEFVYDYDELIGKIKSKGFNMDKFAKEIRMNPATFSTKINNKSEFKQGEMIKILRLLDEPISKIEFYFFTM